MENLQDECYFKAKLPNRHLSDVGYWMFANHLKLNADKTELL